MSRSVTMPSWSPRSTTAQVTPASTIRRAASWTVVARLADERSGADQLADRAPSRGQHRLVFAIPEKPDAPAHGPRDEARRGRALEDRRNGGRGDAVDERVLGRPRDKAQRTTVKQGEEAEHLPFAHHVHQAVAGHELDRTAADDIHEFRGRFGALDDRRAGGVKLDLGACGERRRASPRRARRTAGGGGGTPRCHACRSLIYHQPWPPRPF